jgi:dihydroorotase
MSDQFDLLLAGGTVIDPARGTRKKLDVAVAGGRILAIEADLPRGNAHTVLDANGCYVTPGLIDFHIHSYWGVNPYGFNADPVCVATGVTTAVDAGSAGPVNFSGFRKLVHEQARTRMLGFIALAQHGVLNDPGELENLRFADPEGAARAVAENRDIAVGIKIRLHKKSVGENGGEALRLAVKAGDACQAPVMVHVGNTGITMEEIVESLRPGDIVTHCYTPQQPSILDDKGRLRTAVRRARERGVLFDVAHANGHFDFSLVRRAMGEGLTPDIISTDLHGRMGADNPVVDLPTTLTKFLALGLTFDEVIAACTANPARAIGAQGRLGGLEKDGEADVAVLQLVNQKTRLRDCVGAEMDVEQRIVARWTIRRGILCVSNDQTIL